MKIWLVMFGCVWGGWSVAGTEEPVSTLRVTQPAEGPVSSSIEREADVAITRGVRWLAARQLPDGGWSTDNDLSSSAFSLLALVYGGCADPDAIRRAVRHLSEQARHDGSFRPWPDPEPADETVLRNTALCALALHAADNVESRPLVRKARRYLIDAQSGPARSPLTPIVVEAIRQTAPLELDRPDESPSSDFDWNAAADRVARILDRPASDRRPLESLLLLRLTDARKDDPRVRSILGTIPPLDAGENDITPSRPDYFSLLLTRAKALAAVGCDTLVDREGRRVNWREETLLALINTQIIEPRTGSGFWRIQSNTPEKTDPIRSTALAILTLRIASRP